jgi:hypothetical protein
MSAPITVIWMLSVILSVWLAQWSWLRSGGVYGLLRSEAA